MPERPRSQRSHFRRLDLSAVLQLAPADATVVPAVLVCVCTAVPLLLLMAAGRLDVAAYAAFGAFTGLYGRNEPYRQRALTLATVAAVLVGSVALGAVVGVLTNSGAVHIVLIAVVAGLAKLLLDVARAGPPGGLMPTFAAAVTVSAVTEADQVPVAVGLCAAVAVWSWLVSMSPRLVRPDGPQRVATARALDAVAHRVETAGTPAHDHARHAAGLALERAWHTVGLLPPGGPVERFEVLLVHAETAMRQTRLAVAAGATPSPDIAAESRTLARRLRRGELPPIATNADERAEVAGIRAEAELLDPSTFPLHRTARPSWRAALSSVRLTSPVVALAGRTALAAALAGMAAAAVGLGYSYWASVSAVAVLAATNLSVTTHRAVQRAVGSAVGVLIGVAALMLASGSTAAVVLVIVCTVLAELTVTRNYALVVLFTTPIALVLAALAHPLSMLELARDRFLDTVVGAVVAIAVALLVPNRGLGQALQAAVDGAEAVLASAATSDPVDRLAVARTVASRLSALRTAYDAATGEPWWQDIPVEKVLSLERDCHTALARLTA